MVRPLWHIRVSPSQKLEAIDMPPKFLCIRSRQHHSLLFFDCMLSLTPTLIYAFVVLAYILIVSDYSPASAPEFTASDF